MYINSIAFVYVKKIFFFDIFVLVKCLCIVSILIKKKNLLGGSLSDLAVTGLDPDFIGENVCVELTLLRVGLMLRWFLSRTLASNDTYGEVMVAH